MTQAPGAPQYWNDISSDRGRCGFSGQSNASAGAASLSSDAGRRPQHDEPEPGRSQQTRHVFPAYNQHRKPETGRGQSNQALHSYPAQTQQPAPTSHDTLPQHKNIASVNIGIQRTPTQNGAQSPSYNNFSSSAEGRRGKASPFSPTSSSPPIRNSFSSHIGDLGRRLAEERSKNSQLMQRISELEHTVSLLQPVKQVDGTGMDNHLHGIFSSSPVGTPTGSLSENSLGKDGFGIKHGHEFEETVKKSDHLSQHGERANTSNGSLPKAPCFGMQSDPSVVKLLEQATRLLSETDHCNTSTSNQKSADSQPSGNCRGNERSSLTQERIREYHELVTEFHSEQQSHGDLDGEELISREDILWLFSELQWRFEEIHVGYMEDRRENKDSRSSGNQEWKLCLEGLAGIVKETMSSAPPLRQTSNPQQLDRHTNESVLSNDTRILQDEVSSLNQRLASFTAQHKEACGSLNDDMEAMKRDYQEQIAKKSQCIQNLESKMSEQEEYIAQIQKEKQKDQRSIQEEKRKLSLSKEGTAVRIQYLEGMLRSLQIELKAAKTPQKTKSSGVNGADVGDEGGTMSPPVFMRDLTSALHDVNQMQQELATTNGVVDDESKYKAEVATHTPSLPGDREVRKLLDQIALLGNSLAVSETSRANLLDDFQQERKNYTLQYKQMSGILKLLIEEQNI